MAGNILWEKVGYYFDNVKDTAVQCLYLVGTRSNSATTTDHSIYSTLRKQYLGVPSLSNNQKQNHLPEKGEEKSCSFVPISDGALDSSLQWVIKMVVVDSLLFEKVAIAVFLIFWSFAVVAVAWCIWYSFCTNCLMQLLFLSLVFLFDLILKITCWRVACWMMRILEVFGIFKQTPAAATGCSWWEDWFSDEFMKASLIRVLCFSLVDAVQKQSIPAKQLLWGQVYCSLWRSSSHHCSGFTKLILFLKFEDYIEAILEAAASIVVCQLLGQTQHVQENQLLFP